MACRIGVIGDGPTDRKVAGRLAECILASESSDSRPLQVIELGRQSIRGHVDAYLREAANSNDYSVSGNPGKALRNAAFLVLQNARGDFASQAKEPGATRKEVIVPSTDPERHFRSPEACFVSWAVHLPKILLAATEFAYHTCIERGYPPSSIPALVP